jgi:hypothetical protein
MSPLIAQYQTRSDDSKFSSFLADFQRALNLRGFVSLAVAAIPSFIYYQSPFLVAYQSLSAGQIPAVGSQVGCFVGTLNVSAIAALESTTDVPVDGSVIHYR